MHPPGIPSFLRSINRWCLWILKQDPSGKPRKVPVGRSGYPININLTKNLMSYSEALTLLEGDDSFSGLGFSIPEDRTLVVIDLDKYDQNKEAHDQILSAFKETYIEKSQSGNGWHIFLKGKIEYNLKNKFNHGIEIYDSNRYFAVTGDGNDLEVCDCQEILHELCEVLVDASGIRLSDAEYSPQSSDELYTDEQVIDKVYERSLGKELFEGFWQDRYNSQSEADQALVNMIWPISKNIDQSIRIFRTSDLGQRPKASRNDYVTSLVKKASDLDYTNDIQINREEKLANPENKSEKQVITQVDFGFANEDPGSDVLGLDKLEYPPNLAGRLAAEIYEMSPRKNNVIAVASAFAILAGMFGNKFTVENSFINLYLCLIANPGTGKETPSLMANKLYDQLYEKNNLFTNFMGPKSFASSQGLVKYLADNNCFMSVLGEFHGQMLNWHDGSTISRGIRDTILDIYGKASPGNRVSPIVYSDKTKNTQTISNVSLTLLGESNPEHFWGNCDDSHFNSGFLPRFIFLESKEPRQLMNKNRPFTFSDSLVEEILDLWHVTQKKKVISGFACDPIELTHNASLYSDEIDLITTNIINKYSEKGRMAESNEWGRAHLNSLKLAGILALNGSKKPVVTDELLDYAWTCVGECCSQMIERLQKGIIGQNTVSGVEMKIRRRIETLFSTTDIIPRAIISKRILNSITTTNNVSITKILDSTLKSMVSEGLIGYLRDAKINGDVFRWVGSRSVE